MVVIQRIEALREKRRTLAGSLGLVPTMGFLHEGHLALVRRARSENDLVGVSIFANPIQFDSPDDFTAYPRNLDRDLEMLRREGVDLVFAPPASEIYPEGFATYVAVEGITDRLEGQARPGHFRGVTTVVAKLFNIFQPDRAYLGQKDAQQVRVIQQMVADLAMPLQIVTVPTVRDADGLALSSRNAHLSPDERQVATAIPAALRSGLRAYAAGEKSADRIRRVVIDHLSQELKLQTQYVSVADPVTLAELDVIDDSALLSLAVFVGETRLIDNVMLQRDTANHDL